MSKKTGDAYHALIVDDDPVARLLASKALDKIGFETEEAEDGEEALAVVDRSLPDLILLDVEMPGLNGFETCRILRERHTEAALPILMATGMTDNETIERAFGVGATDFIKKPIDWELLQHRVRFLMRGTDAIVNLQSAQRVARAASRAKLNFLTNMSHELRTPMTAIVGFIEELHGDDADSISKVERGEAVESIRRNSTHLLQLIEDMLEACRTDATEIRPRGFDTDLTRVLHDVTDGLQAKAGARGLYLRTTCEPASGAVMRTDPVRLRHILTHLLTNAVKFTDSGGVEVSLRCGSIKTGERIAEIVVVDTGIGMTREETSRAFQVFTQADETLVRARGGTGLGLTIVRRMVEALGGGIELKSEPGKGTRFRMRIPSLPAESPGTETVAESTPEIEDPTHTRLDLTGKRVLVVEDSPDNQRLIGFLVRKLGADVTLAADGREGVDIALEAEGREPFDLVLMDMQMPVLDGYSATAELKRAGFDRPIVALTAHAMQGDRERCLAAGCDDYATKPLNGQTVRRIATQWIGPKAKTRS